MASSTQVAVLLVAAVLLVMDLLSAAVVGPPPAPAPATAAAPSSASAAASASGAPPAGLHVRLCTACSYKGYFNLIATQLQERYGADNFRATASTYPPSFPRRAAAGAATLAQAAALSIALAGDRVLPALGAGPSLLRAYEERVRPRRTAFALAAWFFPNAARQAAESTGAFEVSWDGEPLFSKLERGRFPSADELAAAIDRRVLVSGGLEEQQRGERGERGLRAAFGGE